MTARVVRNKRIDTRVRGCFLLTFGPEPDRDGRLLCYDVVERARGANEAAQTRGDGRVDAAIGEAAAKLFPERVQPGAPPRGPPSIGCLFSVIGLISVSARMISPPGRRTRAHSSRKSW